MGRPIKKNKMSAGASGLADATQLAGNIAVTAYRPYGGSKTDSLTAYVVALGVPYHKKTLPGVESVDSHSYPRECGETS